MYVRYKEIMTVTYCVVSVSAFPRIGQGRSLVIQLNNVECRVERVRLLKRMRECTYGLHAK